MALGEDVVNEFIEGLAETYTGLQYLDGFPQVKVVIRSDVSSFTYDKVAIISGGGSGHEPAHTGFVGEGMLTAAICGDIFASPTVDAILAGIRAVTGSKGCLLIVKNYTGDRLNFGLAAEQAKSEGFKVEMVIVGDDCALPPPRGVAGRRGLAGTILVHKIAGAAPAAGLSLPDVAAEAKHASEMVGTMGVALSVCTLPGQVTPDRLGPGKMEFGLGIHGEPGAAVTDLLPVDVIVSHVLKQILSMETNYVPIVPGNRVVLMINGLGATPLMELMITAGKTVPLMQLNHGLAVDRVYTGSFMTSLDMAGFSISIMKADEKILRRLDAPTRAPSWPVGVQGDRPPAKIPIPVPASRSTTNEELSSAAMADAQEKEDIEIWKINSLIKELESLQGTGLISIVMPSSKVPEEIEKHVEKVEEKKKQHLNVVFVGHVGAGKSTTCWTLLALSGQVDDRTIRKYEKEAENKKLKSWYVARVMDADEDERVKGQTVEVGNEYFETETTRFTILDAPGDKSCVPNMICGASQADIGVLVVSACIGEFETGYERGGQTCEQIQLAKSLGLSKLLVVVNKMDAVDWLRDRYDEIVLKIIPFLRSFGYCVEKDVMFLPISSWFESNMKTRVDEIVCPWWYGPCLFEVLDAIEVNGPFRFPNDQMCWVMKMLDDEYRNASTIENTSDRTTLDAIISAQQRLTGFHYPANGLMLYSGTVISDDGRARKVDIDFEPFRPVNEWVYMCNDKFHTESLKQLLKPDDKYGFIIMAGDGALFGTLTGNSLDILHRFTVHLPSKIRRGGGESAVSLDQLHREQLHDYVRKTSEFAREFYIDPVTRQPNVSGLVIAGTNYFKDDLSESELFDESLKSKILVVVDVYYGGSSGLRHAVDLAAKTIPNVKFYREREVIREFFKNVSVGPDESREGGRWAVGIRDTVWEMTRRNVDILIVWEHLDIRRYILRDSITGDSKVKFFNTEEEQDEANFRNIRTGNVFEVERKESVLQWLADIHKYFGCRLVFVGNTSQEGSQFCVAFGGIGATLLTFYGVRYYEWLSQNDDDDDGMIEGLDGMLEGLDSSDDDDDGMRDDE
ncbi:hypothetical protein QQ045_033005 [Rhodiola kirilowii]